MPKVLIIDDEEFTVDMLQTFLQMSGFETVGAYNGEDGIVLTQIESPDVIILDLMLPDLEGYDVCRRLRGFPQTANLPILILSARTTQVDKDRALSAGADAYLTKPVQFPQLLIDLHKLLSTPRAPQAAPISEAPTNETLLSVDGATLTDKPLANDYADKSSTSSADHALP